ncbi:MAG: hypothetical protein WDM88_10410 [Galbitalea sp.]
MSQSIFAPTRRGWLRYAALAAVVLVPLAFAGLFIGAVSQVKHSISDIPAAIVNNDQLVMQTAADGTSTPVLAGRELVTRAHGQEVRGLRLDDHQQQGRQGPDLANGTVYAILTVPKDFSKSIVSLSSKSARQGEPVDHNRRLAQLPHGPRSPRSSATPCRPPSARRSPSSTSPGSIPASAESARRCRPRRAARASSRARQVALSTGLDSYVAGVSTVPSGLRQLQSGIETAKGSVTSQALTPYTSAVSGYSSQLSADVAALAADPGNASLLAAGAGRQRDPLVGRRGRSLAVVGGVGSAFDTPRREHRFLRRPDRGPLPRAGRSWRRARSRSPRAPARWHPVSLRVRRARPSYTKAQIAQDRERPPPNPVGVSVDRQHEVSSPAQIIATLFVPLGLWIGCARGVPRPPAAHRAAHSPRPPATRGSCCPRSPGPRW